MVILVSLDLYMKSSELLTLSRLMRHSALSMLNHRDIDLHIYTDEPMVEKSFSFMKSIAENKAVKDIQ
jgi:hypothetical protein